MNKVLNRVPEITGTFMGDLLAQPAKNGGYSLGMVGTSILFLSIIVSLIIYLSIKQKKIA